MKSMSKEINLENIFHSICTNENKVNKDSIPFILKAMKQACEEVLQLAAENSTVEVIDHEEKFAHLLPGYDNDNDNRMVILPIYGVDEQSILNTINQVKWKWKKKKY